MRNDWTALCLYLVLLALAFGWRTMHHRRFTGANGFHGI
jgi:hypothetical protein